MGCLDLMDSFSLLARYEYVNSDEGWEQKVLRLQPFSKFFIYSYFNSCIYTPILCWTTLIETQTAGVCPHISPKSTAPHARLLHHHLLLLLFLFLSLTRTLTLTHSDTHAPTQDRDNKTGKIVPKDSFTGECTSRTLYEGHSRTNKYVNGCPRHEHVHTLSTWSRRPWRHEGVRVQDARHGLVHHTL